MSYSGETRCTAFVGFRQVASGPLTEVALKTKEDREKGVQESVLIFDDETGQQLDVDLRGTVAEVVLRLGGEADEVSAEAQAPRGPGRPKLGVVAREVTLLPRHWEWLNSQPGGASVALRKLVEVARKANREKDLVRQSRDAAYRFMSALAGDLPGFEEAARALYRGNREGFDALVEPWPADVRGHARKLAQAAFAPADDGPRPDVVSPAGAE